MNPPKREGDEAALAAFLQRLGEVSPEFPFMLANGDRGLDYACEVDHRGYHWITKERGEECNRLTRSDPEELIYLLLRDSVIQSAAHTEGRAHTDHRRIAFPRQLELMSKHSAAWTARLADEQRAILAREPFDDERYERMYLTDKLVAAGNSSDEAERLASENFPRPKPTVG